VAKIFAPYLVTHGFVWASIDRIYTYRQWNEHLFKQPLDILFTLERVASNSLEGLDGMNDTESAGVIGNFFDGYNALALSGARFAPEYYLAQCVVAPSMEPPLTWFWINYYCTVSY
jgi:predicted dienelactone hydrolase